MQRAFPGAGLEVEARYERSAQWILATVFGHKSARDWCDRKGVVMRKSQGEEIGSGGAFLVPDELERAILDIRDSYGAFRRRARVWPMGSDSSVFPRRTGSAVAAFIGQNRSAASGASTGVNGDAVRLTAKKLGALVLLSSELDEDSAFGMVDYVANEAAWALAAKEDDCAFNGDGTSPYGGMRGIATIATDGAHTKANVPAQSDTFGRLDMTDLGALQSAVRASALPRAAWFASTMGFGQTLSRLAGASGGIYTAMADGILTPYFGGFPIILTQKLPLVATVASGQPMIAFGDMYAGAVLGQRRGLTIARSDERYLENDQIGILATERFDAVVHDMGDTVNAGSLAVLVAP
jgi:HK97 family phage major capsid protein